MNPPGNPQQEQSEEEDSAKGAEKQAGRGQARGRGRGKEGEGVELEHVGCVPAFADSESLGDLGESCSGEGGYGSECTGRRQGGERRVPGWQATGKLVLLQLEKGVL